MKLTGSEVISMKAANRVAIVTGASRGLGAAIARVLADRGSDLVIGARSGEPLADVADALARHGARVVPVAGDVADAYASGGIPERGHLGSAAAGGNRALLELAVRSESGRHQRRTVRGAGGGRTMDAASVATADFELPAELEAHEPPEARGLQRDEVRLLVSNLETDSIEHARFADLPRW